MARAGRGLHQQGRPTALTPEVQDRIVAAIAAGNYYDAAAAYGGVSYDAFNEWMNRGLQGDGIYVGFRQAILRAEAECEATVVAQWRQRCPRDWRAARDFLARRFANRWAARERVELSGPGGGPVTVRLEDMVTADRELEEWQRARRNGTSANGEGR